MTDLAGGYAVSALLTAGSAREGRFYGRFGVANMEGFECEDLHRRDPIQARIKAIKHDKRDDILTVSEGISKEEAQEGDITKDADAKANCNSFHLLLFTVTVGADAFKDAISA